MTKKITFVTENEAKVSADYLLENAQIRVDLAERVPEDTLKRPVEGTDLVQTLYLHLNETDEKIICLRVEKSLLYDLGIREDDAFKAAAENTVKTGIVKTLTGVIMELTNGAMGLPEAGPTDPMVVSNKDTRMGASIFFVNPEVQKKMADRFGGSYLILPSSIHEVITMQTGNWTPLLANSMIREINFAEVKREDILSDHAYLYDAEKGTLTNYL